MALKTMSCKSVVKGSAEGDVLFSRSPISFIGGVDPKTGIIMDPLHDQKGQCIADKIFIFPFGKGSSGAGLVLLELSRIGKAPKAIINLRTSTVLMTGPLVIREFYKKNLPILNVSEEEMEELAKVTNLEIINDNGEGKILIK